MPFALLRQQFKHVVSGASITPSSDTNSDAIIFPISLLLMSFLAEHLYSNLEKGSRIVRKRQPLRSDFARAYHSRPSVNEPAKVAIGGGGGSPHN